MLFKKKAITQPKDNLQELRILDQMAQNLIKTYRDAIDDLDGITSDQVESLYQMGKLTFSEYSNLKPAVEALEQIIKGHPALIIKVQIKYREKYNELSQTHDLSDFPKPSLFPY